MEEKIIVKKPVITEKSLKDAARGVFTFLVDKKANKPEIKNAVSRLFKVHARWVTTTVVKGKKRTAGKKRKIVQSPDMKKAFVRLQKGEKIELFEVGQTSQAK
ncbi:50S ribosomal protein L23 [Candidatus Microgenomates bacterium]|nr:50S ribosomal protein L23 [Candidatus Microgenomates bacterium]